MSGPAKGTPTPAERWAPPVIAMVIALAGYFGPWIPHRAAGLVIPGLDMAEVVKFIPEVLSGQIRLLRESFYVPLFSGSIIATFVASRRTLPVWLRLGALVAAVLLACAMLPPAWSPVLLLRPEFRIQVIAIVACLLAILLTGLTRLLPDGLLLATTAVLALIAAIWPAWSFLQVVAPLRVLYATESLLIGWGFWLATAGWLSTAFLALLGALPRRPLKSRPA